MTPEEAVKAKLEHKFNCEIPMEVLMNKYDPRCRKEHPDWYGEIGVNLKRLMDYATQKEIEDLVSAKGS